jgi:hypothetical protein
MRGIDFRGQLGYSLLVEIHLSAPFIGRMIMQENPPATPPSGSKDSSGDIMFQTAGDANTPGTPSSASKDWGIVWRLAQIVLVLAAAYLYFYLGSFAGFLQQERIFGNPHAMLLIKLALVGIGAGICLGLATKNLSNGEVIIAVDWPTLVINLLAAGVFVAVSISFNIAAIKSTAIMQGPIKDALIANPLFPFVWVGLTLATLVQVRKP